MKVRVLTAIGMAVVGLPLLLFSDYIIFPIALALLSVISAWELLRVFGFHKQYFVAVPSYAVSLLLPFFAYKLFLDRLGGILGYILVVALVLFAYLLYLAFASVLAKGSFGYKNVASVFMAITYVSVAYTSLCLLRYMQMGGYLFALCFIGAWVCDTFAYFTGMLFGKHKLAPELSPKKTVEGAAGGTAFAVLGFVLYGFIIESVSSSINANYLVLAISGLVVALVAQLGDLWASLIKREYGIKDYSNILPGHGGIMDRFDSIVAVSTVVVIICILFPPFVAV